MSEENCVFCRIVKGEVLSKIVGETDELIAFEDISPSADTHVLIVPKKHMNSFMDINVDLGGKMFEFAKELIGKLGIESAYKIVVNGGRYQEMKHLHMHVLGGKLGKRI